MVLLVRKGFIHKCLLIMHSDPTLIKQEILDVTLDFKVITHKKIEITH